MWEVEPPIPLWQRGGRLIFYSKLYVPQILQQIPQLLMPLFSYCYYKFFTVPANKAPIEAAKHPL